MHTSTSQQIPDIRTHGSKGRLGSITLQFVLCWSLLGGTLNLSIFGPSPMQRSPFHTIIQKSRSQSLPPCSNAIDVPRGCRAITLAPQHTALCSIFLWTELQSDLHALKPGTKISRMPKYQLDLFSGYAKYSLVRGSNRRICT